MEKDNLFIDRIFKNKWTPFYIVIILGFLVYGRTLFFNFTYLDDNVLILDNQYFLSSLSSIFKSFSVDVFHLFNSSAFYYRPILTISLIFDYQIGGLSPFMYHFTNIILHIISSYLVFIFLFKLNYKKTISFLFGIIFLVHPVLTQAVAWVPGRNDSLLVVFALSCFIFFIKYLKEEKNINLFWSLIFFTLAIFTKESGVFIIPIILFYLIFIFKEKKLSLKEFYFFFWSIGIIGLWGIARHFALNNSNSFTILDMIKSIFFNLPAIPQFIGKIFLPFNLSVLPIIQDTTFIYGIISIVLLFVIILFTRVKRWNFILLGIGWFFVFLLPSFIRPNTALVADFIEHRLYLPIIGIFIILLETDLIKNINLKKKYILFIIGSIIFIFSIVTIIHTGNFINRLSFWKNARDNSPHYPLAHRNLGAMKFLDGDMVTAEKEFKIALELNPSEAMAHNNLGLIYARSGRLEEAEKEYKKELEVNPYYDNAYFNLGLLYFEQKRNGEAIENWKKVLNFNSSYLDALKALTSYYYNEKNYKEAIIYASVLYRMGFHLPPELLRIVQLTFVTPI